MRLHVVFHHLAAKDAREAEQWYACRSPDAAAGFRTEVKAAAEQIAASVNTHAISPTRYHYVRVARFPYRLIYVVDAANRATVG